MQHEQAVRDLPEGNDDPRQHAVANDHPSHTHTAGRRGEGERLALRRPLARCEEGKKLTQRAGRQVAERRRPQAQDAARARAPMRVPAEVAEHLGHVRAVAAPERGGIHPQEQPVRPRGQGHDARYTS